jgi:hypothetical protein
MRVVKDTTERFSKCPWCGQAVPLTKTGRFKNHTIFGAPWSKDQDRCPRSGTHAKS